MRVKLFGYDNMTKALQEANLTFSIPSPTHEATHFGEPTCEGRNPFTLEHLLQFYAHVQLWLMANWQVWGTVSQAGKTVASPLPDTFMPLWKNNGICRVEPISGQQPSRVGTWNRFRRFGQVLSSMTCSKVFGGQP